MKGTRKKYDAKFKAKVALETIKERETLNELAVKYEVSPVMISRWKIEFIENSAAAFEVPKVDDASIEKEKDRYLRVIGDLQMQLVLFATSFSLFFSQSYFPAYFISGFFLSQASSFSFFFKYCLSVFHSVASS